jgi:serine protease Do
MPLPVPGRVGESLRRWTVVVRSGAGGMGSGVLLHDNFLITNAHVVRAREVTVESWEGRTATARLLRVDRGRDLALLEAKGLHSDPAQLGDSDLVRPGMPVVAVGNPLGFTGAMSSGTIHSVMVGAPYRWLCADVHLAPGNSGGPLADLTGQVIGINTMVMRGGLALAVPSRSVQAFIKGSDPRRQLGITVHCVSTGLIILEVAAGSAADQASLLPGDLLQTADDRPLRSAEDLQLAAGAADDILSIGFRRGGESRVRRVAVRIPRARAATAA